MVHSDATASREGEKRGVGARAGVWYSVMDVPDLPSPSLRILGRMRASRGRFVSCHLSGGLVLADPMGLPYGCCPPVGRFPRGAGSDGHKGKGPQRCLVVGGSILLPAKCHATAVLAGWLIWPAALESHRAAAHRERHGSIPVAREWYSG